MLPNYANPCWPDSRGDLHCLPGVLLVGVAKCGTSEIHRNLVSHPDVIEADRKEIAYWGFAAASENNKEWKGHVIVASITGSTETSWLVKPQKVTRQTLLFSSLIW